ncbi:MAG: hypothetical protein GY861_14490 [bacterium]|nr:hypothetical protein [bacterium]
MSEFETGITLDIDITVNYEYEHGQKETRIDPSYPACAEIQSVMWGEVDILKSLSKEQCEELTEECIEDYEESNVDSREPEDRDEY